MAVEIIDLTASVRTGTGKGAARQARRDGVVPGVVYGAGKEPVAINVPFYALLKRLKAGRFMSTIFNLKVEGQDDVKVVCRNVQRHVVKDMPIHIDFLRVEDTTSVKLFIDVNFVNADAAPGIVKGAVLNVAAKDIELVLAAGNIPASVDADLTGKNIGDTVLASEIILPEGAKLASDRDAVIGTIVVPSGVLITE